MKYGRKIECIICHATKGTKVKLYCGRWTNHWVHYGCFRHKLISGQSECPACGERINLPASAEVNFVTSFKLDVVKALRMGDAEKVVRLIQRYDDVECRDAIREGMRWRVDSAISTVFNPFGREDGLPKRSRLFRQVTELPKASTMDNLDYLLLCVSAADEFEMARVLLEAGASPAADDDQALLAAVELGSNRLFRLLMSRRSAKVPVNERVQCRAATLDRAEIILHLIRLGACGKVLGTALEQATQAQAERTSKTILIHGDMDSGWKMFHLERRLSCGQWTKFDRKIRAWYRERCSR